MSTQQRPIRQFISSHLASRQVSRVVYGSIIGLALVVALQAHPPKAGVMVATLLGTAVAVGLAEAYSELVGFETMRHRRPDDEERHHLRADIVAVAFGIAFPAVFFLLAAVGVFDDDTAFTIAKWTGLALIGLYGVAGGRLSGRSWSASLLQGAAVALIGAFVIAVKSLVH